MNRWAQRAWWKLRRKHIIGGQVKIPAGETISIRVPRSKVRPHDLLVLRWTCQGCDGDWRKKMLARDAEQYGIRIACPVCDPDELSSRDVQPD